MVSADQEEVQRNICEHLEGIYGMPAANISIDLDPLDERHFGD